MTRHIGFAAALAVLLMLVAVVALLLVERWGNRQREAKRIDDRARRLADLVTGQDNVVSLWRRGGRQ